MTETVIISIITSMAAVLVSSVSAYFAFRAKQVSSATHLSVNSRMDEFKRIAEKLFHAQGKAEGRAEIKAERKRK